jgi:hypothetical protein
VSYWSEIPMIRTEDLPGHGNKEVTCFYFYSMKLNVLLMYLQHEASSAYVPLCRKMYIKKEYYLNIIIIKPASTTSS